MGIWQNGVKQEVQEYMRFCHETFGPGAEFSEKIGLLEPFFFLNCNLLKGAFPHLSGFQNPILQDTNCFNIQRSTEFIQCLNVAGMHWITIATVGCTHGTVRVYDSLNKKLTY